MSVIVTILLLIALVFGAWEMIKFIFKNMQNSIHLVLLVPCIGSCPVR